MLHMLFTLKFNLCISLVAGKLRPAMSVYISSGIVIYVSCSVTFFGKDTEITL